MDILQMTFRAVEKNEFIYFNFYLVVADFDK